MSNKHKQNYEEDGIQYDGAGNEIHIFNGPLGKAFVKKLSAINWLPTGEQYCPNCHCLMNHKDSYWECDKCGHIITDDEANNGDGYPTLDATYENDYGIYYDEDEIDEDDEDFDSGYEDYDVLDEYE